MRYNIVVIVLFITILSNDLRAHYEVMVSDSYPPYNFVNTDGDLVGFNIDILNAIKELYEIDIRVTKGYWSDVHKALESGEVNAIAGVHYPQSPDNNYIYTRSTINTSHCFLYNVDHIKRFSLKRFRTLKKPLVVLWKNDVITHYVHSINPSANFLFVNNYNQLISALDRKDVTCVFAQRVVSMYQSEKLGKKNIRSLEHRILERNMGFKVCKDSPELVDILNNGLEVILANGEYQRIYDKWITEYNQSHTNWNKYFKYILIIGVLMWALFLILLIFNRILKSRIKIKTQDLQQQLTLNSEIMTELKMQKSKAEESDKMKSIFLANMSHEIRTPMNGILGFTELLKSVDYSSQEQKRFIDIIERSGNRMLGTINNIIDVSKLESGLEEPQCNKVNIKNILSDLQAFFIPETNAKGIKLIIEDKGMIAYYGFDTDEYKLTSILTNLIKNAIKFTIKGYVSITYSVNDNYAEFWIADSGIGIAHEKQALIFDQFMQADISHSRAHEGSGLGLSIAKGYVTLLKGEIKLVSKPKKGTTFYVRIPRM